MKNNMRRVPWQHACMLLDATLAALAVTGASDRERAFADWWDMAAQVRENDRTLYLVGNGASASMASHFAADLSKNAAIRAQVFTDLSQITAIGNDVGFEHIYAVPLARYARPGDMLVAISSSGRSPNIVSAVHAARQAGVFIVTLSAFAEDNPLRQMGNLNFYVPARSHGLAVTCHAAILHHWMDGLVVEHD